jgi:putative MATE family efflux protein
MRGMGDSVRPLMFVGISCTTNILLDLILVGGLHMGASGAAGATVFSQAMSLILCVVYLRKNHFLFDFRLSSFGFRRKSLLRILKIGLPTSIQNIVTGISFMVLTSIVNTLGVTASAAVGAVGKVSNFALMPTLAMQASIIAMSAQNIGAKEYGRAKSTMKVGMTIVCTISFIIVLIVQIIPSQILRLFCNDQDVIANGVIYIKHLSFDYLPATFLLCFIGLFIGAGYSKFSLISSMLSAVFLRVPVAYILGIKYGQGLSGIGLAAPIATTGAFLLAILFYYSGIWKNSYLVSN